MAFSGRLQLRLYKGIPGIYRNNYSYTESDTFVSHQELYGVFVIIF